MILTTFALAVTFLLGWWIAWEKGRQDRATNSALCESYRDELETTRAQYDKQIISLCLLKDVTVQAHLETIKDREAKIHMLLETCKRMQKLLVETQMVYNKQKSLMETLSDLCTLHSIPEIPVVDLSTTVKVSRVLRSGILRTDS
jgi:hypothetical protein